MSQPSVALGDGVSVFVASIPVALGVKVKVAEGGGWVMVGVSDGVPVAVGVSDSVGVKLGVGVRLGVCDGGTKAVQVGVGESLGVEVIVGVNAGCVKTGCVGVQLGVKVAVACNRSGARCIAIYPAQ